MTVGMWVAWFAFTKIHDTTDVAMATMITRKYSIKAVKRGSAPKEPQSMTMVEAAPGEVPQRAVVPGMTRNHAKVAPVPKLTMITERTLKRTRDQCSKIWCSTEIDRLLTTTHAKMAWASVKYRVYFNAFIFD